MRCPYVLTENEYRARESDTIILKFVAANIHIPVCPALGVYTPTIPEQRRAAPFMFEGWQPDWKDIDTVAV